ncbi:hypothetical protein RchiOBHm_Chr1g0382051 [Rosa chinensis]|uniref:Uncharacterized protein n=1 Tax=Rosa chinensis TaxID=74649 RepID=A0A2P6SPA8_ROSCH|nr:hypothetical protein RchiOBHm_Chr1g0382051 [Rosa chinensis]
MASSSSLAGKGKRHPVLEDSPAFCLRIFSREDLKDGKKNVLKACDFVSWDMHLVQFSSSLARKLKPLEFIYMHLLLLKNFSLNYVLSFSLKDMGTFFVKNLA